MQLELIDFWKVLSYDRRTRCFSMYCGKPSLHFCKVKVGEMEFRLVLCEMHFKYFKSLADMEETNEKKCDFGVKLDA